MKVKIIADGSLRGTRVVDAQGNDVAQKLSGVSFEHHAGQEPKIKLQLCLVDASVEGTAKFYGPSGKAVKKIVYDDGSEDVFA